MERYCALIEGYNFLVDLDGHKTRVGFYTTFYLDGDTIQKKDVLNIILYQLDERINKGDVYFFDSLCSFICLSELSFIEDDSANRNLITNGFTFFRVTKFQSVTNLLVYYVKEIMYRFKLLDSLKRPILYPKKYDKRRGRIP